MNIIGRKREIERFNEILGSKQAEFVAVYGRRRVGKTFLISQFFQGKGCYIEAIGTKDGNMLTQLTHFSQALAKVFAPGLSLAVPSSWEEAFTLFTDKIEQRAKSQKVILFLDELPWLATRRSQLVQQIDYFWNTRWSRIPNFILIVCGSAASWMLDNLINANGGLYNRITQSLLLKPFTLSETKVFLDAQHINYTYEQILDIYMAIGGIPHYLKQIKRGKSTTQNLNALCFSEDGILLQEFSRLFRSLFKHSEQHEKIVRAIAEQRFGIASTVLAKKIKVVSGGRLKKRLDELEACDIIEKFIPMDRKIRDHYYKIRDEYTLFYLTWIEKFTKNRLARHNTQYWQQIVKTPAWQAWAGYSFEAVCYKHIDAIIKILDLTHIPCQPGSWRHISPKGSREQGVQIDLILDRDDGVITLCEMKYTDKTFVIDKNYAANLKAKIEVFSKYYPVKKPIQVILISAHGLKINLWSEDLIDKVITLEDIFNAAKGGC